MSSDAPAAATYSGDPYYYSVNRGTKLTAIFFLLFLILLILICVYCCCRWCSRQGRQRRRRAAALISILSGGVQVHEIDNGAGLDPSIIASLPTFTYRKQTQNSDGEAAALECAVCLGAVEEGEVGRLLPNCKHVFHVDCIDEWLRVNSTCPVCRGKVVPVKEAADGAVLDQLEAASGSRRLQAVELRDVGDASAREPACADGAVGTKEIGSGSRLASSFRKMVGRDWSGRRSSASGVGEDDVERQ